MQIHRQPIVPGQIFSAPNNVTLGFQPDRDEFSVWYSNRDDFSEQYILVGTGHECPKGNIVQTVILPDGFHAFHLVRIT